MLMRSTDLGHLLRIAFDQLKVKRVKRCLCIKGVWNVRV